jgi:hypothetical protein
VELGGVGCAGSGRGLRAKRQLDREQLELADALQRGRRLRREGRVLVRRLHEILR